MLKIIFNTILLFVLMIGNMALISWYINQFALGKASIEKTLIHNVQADAIPANKDFSHLISQKQQGRSSSSSTPSKEAETNKEEITLQFKESNIYLDKAEQKRLEEILKTLNINGSSTILVSVGPAPGGENILTLQTSRLRAQTVARFIYPYTQSVKMRYIPSLEVGTVVVEFFQSLGKKIQTQ